MYAAAEAKTSLAPDMLGLLGVVGLLGALGAAPELEPLESPPLVAGFVASPPPELPPFELPLAVPPLPPFPLRPLVAPKPAPGGGAPVS